MRSARAAALLSAAGRSIAGLAGAALVARGIAPVVAAPTAPGASTPEFGPPQLALLVLGSVLLLVAACGPRSAAAYRATGVIALNSLILVSVLELAAARGVRDEKPQGPPEPRDLFGPGRDSGSLDSLARDATPAESRLPYYQGKQWATQHWRELRAAKADYQPYVLWRRAPFRGQTITVNDDGYRVTPGSDCIAGAYTVFVLGGSTVWGFGVPDGATVPAYLARELRTRRNRPVCVLNLGELGFNSTQDLIELERQLQAGRIPDVAVFYQGINDVWTAAQNGKPGLHFYLEEIARRLEGGADEKSASSWLARSNLFRFAAQHGLRRGAAEPERLPAYMSKHWIAPDSLGAQVARVYLQNYAMVEALAREYGFAFEMFWQPNLLAGGKPLVEAEAAFRQREADEGADWVALVERSYAHVAAAVPQHPHLHFLANAFGRDTTVLYSDWAHLNPAGNERVARLIAAALSDSVGAGAGPLARSRARRAVVAGGGVGQRP